MCWLAFGLGIIAGWAIVLIGGILIGAAIDRNWHK